MNVKIISLFSVCFLIGIMKGMASYASDSLVIGENKLVSFPDDSMAKTEPHLVIDPTNANHLIVACISTYPSNTPSRGYVSLYNSLDGGKTWDQRNFSDTTLMGGDPWLCINKRGIILLSFLMRDTTNKWHLLVFRSENKGVSWHLVSNFPSGHDHQTIVLNPVTDEFVLVSVRYRYNSNKKLHGYINTHQYTADGKSAGEPKEHFIGNIGINTLTTVFTDDGILVIPYIDYKDENEKIFAGKRSWVVTSTNNGMTISVPRLIVEDKFSGTFPTSAIDHTGGKFHNSIYFIKMRENTPTNIGIGLYKSMNKGESWSEEIKVGFYDKPDAYMRNPTVAVNNKGVVGVYWYDRRDDSLQLTQPIYFCYSTDGGNTFSQPVRITSAPSIFSGRLMWADQRYRGGGEYSGIATLADGSFQLIWADRRNGRYQLFTANVGFQY